MLNDLLLPKHVQSNRALRGVGYEPEAKAGLNIEPLNLILKQVLGAELNTPGGTR